MKEKERKGEMGEEERQGREGDCKEKKNALHNDKRSVHREAL